MDVNLRWFSPLFVWKRSHIRQFLSLNYTQGWNRLEGSDEVLRFTAQDGLSLLKEDLVGTNRMVLNTETVFFTPYQPLGFRIALFGFADFGLLGRDANIFKNNFYTTFGLGVRLRNERLVFSTIRPAAGRCARQGRLGRLPLFPGFQRDAHGAVPLSAEPSRNRPVSVIPPACTEKARIPNAGFSGACSGGFPSLAVHDLRIKAQRNAGTVRRTGSTPCFPDTVSMHRPGR